MRIPSNISEISDLSEGARFLSLGIHVVGLSRFVSIFLAQLRGDFHWDLNGIVT